MISVIVPTYNERQNIAELIRRIQKAFSLDGAAELEILVMDDDSPDGTAEAAAALNDPQVRVVNRKGKPRGLAAAVIDGFNQAHGGIVGVIDADFSHPPEVAPSLVAAIREGSNLAVGSRYVPGGGIRDWPFHRVFSSRLACILARPLTGVRDATSGFFFLKKEILEGVFLNPLGFKIGLEVFVRSRHEGKIKEVPYLFTDRKEGTSKLSASVIRDYFAQIFSLFFNKTAATIFMLICLATAGVSFYFSVAKPFTLDETDLATRAHMIRVAGPRGPELFYGAGNGEAIPHPPMYDYTLALLFRVFGETEVAARGFGIFCFLAVGIFMILTLRYLLEKESPFLLKAATFTALGLYLVNPLVLQHSMLVDADAAYTFLFLNIFVYLFVRFEKNHPEEALRPRLILAFTFALVCLSKEGTPFLAAAGVLIYRFFGREWKKMFLDLFLVFILGTAIAWATWLIFCRATGIDAMIFLKQQYAFRAHRLSRSGLFLKSLKDLPVTVRWPLLWVSPPFFALWAWCLARRARRFLEARKSGLVDLLFFVSAAVWLPYLFFRPSMDMMKYQHPVYPILIAGMVTCLARCLGPSEAALRRFLETKTWAVLGFFFLAVAAGVYYYRLGDSVFFLNYAAHDFRRVAFWSLYWRPLIVGAGAVLGVTVWRRNSIVLPLAAACLIFIFPVNIALDLRQTAPYTTAESWLNYGESGLKETAEYLRTRLSAATPCILRKDLVYYLKFRYGVDPAKNIDPIYLFRDKPLIEAVREYRAGPQPDYVALDPVVMLSNPLIGLVGKKVFEDYALDRKIGSFVLLRRLGTSRETNFP